MSKVLSLSDLSLLQLPSHLLSVPLFPDHLLRRWRFVKARQQVQQRLTFPQRQDRWNVADCFVLYARNVHLHWTIGLGDWSVDLFVFECGHYALPCPRPVSTFVHRVEWNGLGETVRRSGPFGTRR
jgi:hypothetical protein